MDTEYYSKLCKNSFPALEEVVSTTKGAWDKVIIAHLTKGFNCPGNAHIEPTFGVWNLLADFVFNKNNNRFLGYFNYLIKSLRQTTNRKSWAAIESALSEYLASGGLEFKAILGQLVVINTFMMMGQFNLLTISFTDEMEPFRDVIFKNLKTGKTLIVEVWTRDYTSDITNTFDRFSHDLRNDIAEFYVQKDSQVEHYIEQVIAPVIWIHQQSINQIEQRQDWKENLSVKVLDFQSIHRLKNLDGQYFYKSGYIKY